MGEMAGERARLQRELLGFARAGRADDDRFERLAAEVLAYQAAVVPAYGRLVADLKPKALDWEHAPLVPTELFREVDLCSIEARGADTVFRTSGTTHGKRGFRRVPDLSLYRAGMVRPFVDGVLDGGLERRRWVSLIPSAAVLPESSLSFMITELAEDLASEVYWLVDAQGLNREMAARALGEGPGRGEAPVVVVSTSFAMAELLEDLNLNAPLPEGSRVMLTGGFKGRKAMGEAELLAAVTRVLGVPAADIRMEYSMTELTSQAYGTPLRPMSTMRFRIVDPETGKNLKPGQVGLVGIIDILNLDHVSAILTSDLGILDASGALTLQGRQPGAQPRGCSLSAEEILAKLG